MVTETLKETLCRFENGRFKEVILSLKVKEECRQCDFFNLSIKDPRKQYRCRVAGSCIAATLHPDVIKYFNHNLGYVTFKLKGK